MRQGSCSGTPSGSVISIAFFNYFGVSVTKSLSGAARATIDACRTLLIWLFAIWIGWEQFHGLEVGLTDPGSMRIHACLVTIPMSQGVLMLTKQPCSC